MFDQDTDRIRRLMNEYGGAGTPFLFGVNFEMTEGFFIESPLKQEKILFSICGQGNKREDNRQCKREKSLNSFPEVYEVYRKKFATIQKGLMRGDSYLANLTGKTKITASLSIEEVFSLSNAPYQLLVPERFVCFSPERFVFISERRISTNPMKGTIDASLPDAENRILNDYKETAEHNTIVDLLRNDLGMVAENIQVDRFRYIESIKTRQREILQVSSEISGELPEDYEAHLGDIIFTLLPAGSISGAPKSSTIKLIQKAEREERGYYSGVFGYFDGVRLDTAVMIRFIEQSEGELYFRSGGGITVNSVCEEEYRELLDKIYFPFV